MDLVIIQSDETKSASSGINILDALSVNFTGQILTGNWTRLTNWGAAQSEQWTRNLATGLALSVASVTYSLNLANASGAASHIVARPTLLVVDGEKSETFSGIELTAVTDGQLNSQTVTKKVGLKFTVKPKFIDGDTAHLLVQSELSSISAGEIGGTFRQSLQTDSAQTDINAVVKYGQTLLISGGTYKSDSRSSSKTPGLGDMFLSRPLFNKREGTRREISYVALLTLRPQMRAEDARFLPTKKRAAKAKRLLQVVFGDMLGDQLDHTAGEIESAAILRLESRFESSELDDGMRD